MGAREGRRSYPTLVISGAKKYLAYGGALGFFVSGFDCSLPGALLPSWGFDISGDFAAAGRYYLAMAAGLMGGRLFFQRTAAGMPIRVRLSGGAAASAAALWALSYFGEQAWERWLGVGMLGAAAGLLHAGIFQLLLPGWRHSPAAALNTAGLFFGVGAMGATFLAAMTFYIWTVEQTLIALAVVPAACAAFFLGREEPHEETPPVPGLTQQIRSAPTVLFSILLFFQFGSEWSIAAWLPLFLIHRLAVSPAAALMLLVLYFGALSGGRSVVYLALRRIRDLPLLLTSATLSLLGCGILATTPRRFGAVVAILLLGAGFAPIYPLVAATIGRRFSYYQPGFFNGIFSVAVAGGLLAPWLLGEIAGRTGIWAVATFPAIGTCMTMLMLGLIRMHAKVTGQ